MWRGHRDIHTTDHPQPPRQSPIGTVRPNEKPGLDDPVLGILEHLPHANVVEEDVLRHIAVPNAQVGNVVSDHVAHLRVALLGIGCDGVDALEAPAALLLPSGIVFTPDNSPGAGILSPGLVPRRPGARLVPEGLLFCRPFGRDLRRELKEWLIGRRLGSCSRSLTTRVVCVSLTAMLRGGMSVASRILRICLHDEAD